MKHCDSGRLCFSHQSFFALKSATSLVLHWAHSSSGTPCSSHHQPSWLWPATSLTADEELAAVPVFDLLQAVNVSPTTNTMLMASSLLMDIIQSFSNKFS